MKTYNEVNEEIEKLRQIKALLKKELAQFNSPCKSEAIKRKILELESNIEALMWVLS
jgi:predicted nuclease with TOPRIM domain